jgi:hypothetical protein
MTVAVAAAFGNSGPAGVSHKPGERDLGWYVVWQSWFLYIPEKIWWELVNALRYTLVAFRFGADIFP